MSQIQELYYFTDPMCSWCYGFGPELEKLLERSKTSYNLTILPGGLRPDETRAMPASMANEISSHWHHVQQASGLDFNFRFFSDNPGFIYNTTPACKAVVTVNLLHQELAFPYLMELQSRFYARAEDPTQLRTLQQAAQGVGISIDDFTNQYQQEQSEIETRKSFEFSAELGVRGYPTLCLRNQNQLIVITRGFLPAAELLQQLDNALKEMQSSASVDLNKDTSEITGESCEFNYKDQFTWSDHRHLLAEDRMFYPE